MSSVNQQAPSQNDTLFQSPQITLPKGGGAIRGLGEKFTARAATGTSSLSVPLPVSRGRSGFAPELNLNYDSGAGNGVFGLGWSLSLPSITRKTEKGLPQYYDSEESDVFILSGSEDLMPTLIAREEGAWQSDSFRRDGYEITRYRPRIEGLFALIERWSRVSDGDTHWRSLSKDNIVTLYGSTPDSRIADPANLHHVFSWLISSSFDDKGNAILYEYAAENDQGVTLKLANEQRRLRTANRYPKRIKYGNRKPLLVDEAAANWRSFHFKAGDHGDPGWMFEVVFDFGEENYAKEGTQDGYIYAHADNVRRLNSYWPARKDPFSSYRSGFEVRCYRLCRRALMFHRFPAELGTTPCLVRSTEFSYDEKPSGSLLTRVVQSGYNRQPDGLYLKKCLPPLELSYSVSPLESEVDSRFKVCAVDPSSAADLPGGIDGTRERWVDLDGEGISGVLSEQRSAWFYKRNLGSGRFGAPELITAKPSTSTLSSEYQRLMDVNGDGQQNLVALESGFSGFYSRTLDQGWGRFRPFQSMPVVEWKDANLRFVDVTGDGIPDILVTEDVAFTWHPSLLEEGFGPAVRIPAPANEEEGPRIVFADGTQSIYLADMSGDGLTDIVRIRNGEVCYWPNIGYGKFGAKVIMDNAPWFDTEELFDQDRVRLADTDGSGTTDIVYLGHQGILIYLNESGNRLSNPRCLAEFPIIDNVTSIFVTDFLGRGTACIVWSSPLPGDMQTPIRYLDLMRGEKPHLLNRIRNNLGAETAIEYASSTEFYLADKAAGRPWITRLPFPVHVVRRVEIYDHVSRNRFTTSSTYHHGYFDAVEREFRGFARIEHLDTEEIGAMAKTNRFPAGKNEESFSTVPPTLTKTWFHTGFFFGGKSISRHLEEEYYTEPELSPQEKAAMRLPDSVLPGGLTGEAAREACRSLKGSILRQEVYALDRTPESSRPYSITENNFTIRQIQPREQNPYGVYFTYTRETISFSYERKIYRVNATMRADPRVSHTFALEVDAFGNILKSASLGYGRRFPDAPHLLTVGERQQQEGLLATFTENRYTNLVHEPDAYRTPLPSESLYFELIGIEPNFHLSNITNLFRFDELAAKIAALSGVSDEVPLADVTTAKNGHRRPRRRLIGTSRTRYRSNSLSHLLPLGALESLALPGESYKLAYASGLLTRVYRRQAPGHPPEDLLPAPAQVLGDEGGYRDLDGDGRWWIPSGRVFYSPDGADGAAEELRQARRHFFLPRRFQDPFGNLSTIAHDRNDLAVIETVNALGNTTRAQLDYRVLAPRLITDPNGNRSEVSFDALGMVAGVALMGKADEKIGDSLDGFVADLRDETILEHVRNPLGNPNSILGKATMRLVYDLFAFQRTEHDQQPQPAVVYTLARETHESDLAPGQQTKVQHAFSYSDGFSREIQRKFQAEPGSPGSIGSEIEHRWLGSGWTIFNNKGKPVRQYEPFFSTTQAFEFANRVGVSSTLFYDPLDRVVATLHPNHTWEKVVFDPWTQTTWDANDTVLRDPKTDPEAGPFFHLLPEAEYYPTWYQLRTDPALAAAAFPDPPAREAEQDAARKASADHDTPSRAWFDVLGRTILSVAHNRSKTEGKAADEFYSTRTVYDIQGNQLSITDASGRVAMSYAYDLLKNRLYQSSIDAGERWVLNDVVGKPIRKWDSRGYAQSMDYDELRRPIQLNVSGNGLNNLLAEKIIYGDSKQDAPQAPSKTNLRGKVYQIFDAAGALTHLGVNPATGQAEGYDFKGNLLRYHRGLPAGETYKSTLDWNHDHPIAETFDFALSYDALNRPIRMVTPDKSETRPTFNKTNLLQAVDIRLRGAAHWTSFVTHINYDAKGQRQFIHYGNGAKTKYGYDPLTFRLTHLHTASQAGGGALQDLAYTYDPVGNVTRIQDHAQQTIYFKNQVVTPSNDYTYDAIYRLISAKGREHIGQVPGEPPEYDWNDRSRTHLPQPGDGAAMRRYAEQYDYDAVGNFLRMIHRAADGHWTRHYAYSPAGQSPTSNRLQSTSLPGDPSHGPYSAQYRYDAHGNIIEMPHLSVMEWDFKDQLQATRRQVVHHHPGETTYYVYDSSGQRVRKVTETAGGRKKDERIYLGHYEVYRKYDQGEEAVSERQTLHVMDDQQRIALVETRTLGDDETPAQLIRYQFGNQLGSAILELDGSAQIISYEEYYPYGGTSYQAVDPAIQATAKRYRYTGKERDEESGYYYHGARYYAPWLGRWTSCDPGGLIDGINLYSYVNGRPINASDPNGMEGDDGSGDLIYQGNFTENGVTFRQYSTFSGDFTYQERIDPSVQSDVNAEPSMGANQPDTSAPAAGAPYSESFAPVCSADVPAGAPAPVDAPISPSPASGGNSTGAKIADIATDFIPVVGGAKEIYRGIQAGSGWRVALGVGMVAIDVATLGADSLVKGAIETVVKEGAETLAKEATETVVKEGAESITKEATATVAKEAAKSAGDSVIAETLAKRGSFTSSTTLSVDEALTAAEKYLGPGYTEIGKPGSGVFRSADGLRQFRMDANSIAGAHAPGVPHVHFENYAPGARFPTSNNHVPIIQ